MFAREETREDANPFASSNVDPRDLEIERLTALYEVARTSGRRYHSQTLEMKREIYDIREQLTTKTFELDNVRVQHSRELEELRSQLSAKSLELKNAEVKHIREMNELRSALNSKLFELKSVRAQQSRPVEQPGRPVEQSRLVKALRPEMKMKKEASAPGLTSFFVVN